MGNILENLAVVKENQLNNILHLLLPEEEEEYQLFLNNHQHKNYIFWLDVQNLPENSTAYLIDQYLEEETALETGINTINFDIDANSPESIDPMRFKLIFENENFSNENFEMADFSLYPNPTSTHFTIAIPNKFEKTQANIYSITGKLVERRFITSTQNTIDVTKYSSGVYMVEILSNENKTTKKLIVK